MNDTPESARTLTSDAGATNNNQIHYSPAGPLLIGAPEAARVLHIGEKTLWTLTNCQAVPSKKIGRSVRYSPVELDMWVRLGCPTTPGSAARVRAELRREARR